MEKDPLIQIIKCVRRLWREVKKPVLRTNLAAKFTLMPSKNCEEGKQHKAAIRTTFDLTLAYLVISFLVINSVCRFIKRIFH